MPIHLPVAQTVNQAGLVVLDIYFVLMPPFISAGEVTEGENGNLKIIWRDFDILDVALARSVGCAN
jgi:hypothetical protein